MLVNGSLAIESYLFEGLLTQKVARSYEARGHVSPVSTRLQLSCTVSEILEALGGAGLSMVAIQEFPFSHYRKFDTMRLDAKGWWVFPAGWPQAPMLLKVKMVK